MGNTKEGLEEGELLQVLEIRERLHESTDLIECRTILARTQDEITDSYRQMASVFDTANLPAARSLISRLRFLHSILEAAEDKIETLHRSSL